jgi:predicted acylesterase/phospholipase RssA
VISRKSLLIAASIGAAATIARPAAALGAGAADGSGFTRLPSALVLSGGGARGAYQAGVIEALARVAGVGDREVLPGVDAVCGTSIGTLNAWFVATGQYSRIRQLWSVIGSYGLFRLKRRYGALTRRSSGVLTRIMEALSLEQHLESDEQGMLDGDHVARWIRTNIDLHTPLLVPLFFTVTSLSRHTGVLYYRAPSNQDLTALTSCIATIHATCGPTVDVRKATDDVLHEAIRASAAMPMMFDAVKLPVSGGTDQCIDGSISDNTPIDVARAVAKHVYVIFVEPPDLGQHQYTNAMDVGSAAFNIAQRRVTENALRAAILETNAKRLLTASAPASIAFQESLCDVDISYIQPDNTLPADISDFDRQDLIDRTLAQGFADGMRGFQAYGSERRYAALS